MAHPKIAWSLPIVPAIVLILLYELEENIVFPPLIRLLEDAICRQYYAKLYPPLHDVNEAMCKNKEVQTDLAFIRGWFSLLKTLPAILFGPFYGQLADQYGRRPIYALAMIGMMMHLAGIYFCCHFWNLFPIKLVWATSIFLALGGGTFVILALNMTMVADLSTKENRNHMLYLAFALKYVADLIGPQIASVTLTHSLWLPILVCEVLFFMSLLILMILPETLSVDKKDEIVLSDESCSGAYGLTSYRGLLSDWRICIGMSIAFLTQFRYLNESILLPYASIRFSWSISQISRLLSVVPGVSLVIFLSLPFATQTLGSRFSYSKSRQDLLVVKTLLVFLVAGGGMIAAAPSIAVLILALAVFSVGNGIRAPLLAVVSSYIDTSPETGRLYTLMSVTDAFSHMVGDPIIQSIWSAAIGLGDKWLVLPYIVTMLLFVIAFSLAFLLPETTSDQDDTTNVISAGNNQEREPLLGNTY